MARHTLDKMARGGMYDQVGGGFHRYSVDEKWLVPHFEKMLYDNALLAAGLRRGVPAHRRPVLQADRPRNARLRPARDDRPGRRVLLARQDADSEGEEGKFYVWGEAEIDAVLGPDLAPLAKSRVRASPGRGNFEGHNILCRSKTDEQDARLQRLDVGRVPGEAGRGEAAALRGPGEAGLAGPGREDPDRVERADDRGVRAGRGGVRRAAVRRGRGAGGGLRARPTSAGRTAGCSAPAGVGQPAKLAGYLEDYAYLCDALVTLYEATFDPRWLRAAVELADVMLKHFADPAGGGFFFTADDHEQLIARTKDTQDGSAPSGNAMAVTALLRLAALTGRRDLADAGRRTLRAYRGLMAEHPAAAGQMLLALDFYLGPVDEVAVIGPAGGEDTRRALRRGPRTVPPASGRRVPRPGGRPAAGRGRAARPTSRGTAGWPCTSAGISPAGPRSSGRTRRKRRSRPAAVR